MTIPHIKREELKREYILIADTLQSINEIAKNANHVSSSMDNVIAIQIIQNLSQHAMHCSPRFDDIFFPEDDDSSSS